MIACVPSAVGRPGPPCSYCPSTGGSYEKDEMQTELFGIDDQWTKKIYFDRAKLTPVEQLEYPDLKKAPPWIDTVSSQSHTLKYILARRLPLSSRAMLLYQGAGKPKKVFMPVCGIEVCLNGGWKEDPHDRCKPEGDTFQGKGEL